MGNFKTRKSLLKEASRLGAIDLTAATSTQCRALKGARKIASSYGVFGINSALYEKDGVYYVIKSRTAGLFIL